MLQYFKANYSQIISVLKAGACTALLVVVCSGCTVIALTGAAVGVAATAVSTTVDVAVGTAKVGAKVGGAVIDAALPDREDKK